MELKNLKPEQVKAKLPNWNYYSGTCYLSQEASNGAMVKVGEITQVCIAKAYSDGTCYIEVSDGWTSKLICNKVYLKDVTSYACKFFGLNILGV